MVAVVLVLSSSILAGCGKATKKTGNGTGKQVEESTLAWPTVYRDNRHTGRSPYRGPDASQVKWTLEVGAQTRSWVVLLENGNAVCGFIGKVVCVNPSSGAAVWEFPTGGAAASTCRVGDSGDVFVCAGTTVYALSSGGQQKWAFDVGSEADEPSVGSDGTVYVGSAGGRLVALSGGGKLKWEYKVPGNIRSPAISDSGVLYCGASPLVLYAIDKNGGKKWEFKPEGELTFYPEMIPWSNAIEMPSIGDDGTIYAGSLVTGGITSKGPIPNYSMPQYGKLYAVTPEGQKKWEYALTDMPYSSIKTPTIGTDGTLYSGTTCFKVVALKADGSVLWVYDTNEEAENVCPTTYSPPIGKDGLLYVATTSAKVICLTPQGVEKWRFAAENPWLAGYGGSNNFTPPAVASDGTIITTLAQGRIYAFKVTATK